MHGLTYEGLQRMVRKIRSRFVLKAELGMNSDSLVSVENAFDLRRDGEVRVMCGGEMVSLQEVLENGVDGGGQSSEEVFGDLCNGVFNKSISNAPATAVSDADEYVMAYEESGKLPVYAAARYGNTDMNLYGTVLQPSPSSGNSISSIDRYIVKLEKSSSYYKIKVDGKYILPISDGESISLTSSSARAGLFTLQHSGANAFYVKQYNNTTVIKANSAGAILSGVNDTTPSVEERNVWTLYKVNDILSLQTMTAMLQSQAALISSLQSRIAALEQGDVIDFVANCNMPVTIQGSTYYLDSTKISLSPGDTLHVDCTSEIGIVVFSKISENEYYKLAQADYHQPLTYTPTGGIDVYVATYNQQQSPCHVYVVKA